MRAIRKRSLSHLGKWIRFKNRWDHWGMDAAPGFACMQDAIAYLVCLRRHTVCTTMVC